MWQGAKVTLPHKLLLDALIQALIRIDIGDDQGITNANLFITACDGKVAYSTYFRIALHSGRYLQRLPGRPGYAGGFQGRCFLQFLSASTMALKFLWYFFGRLQSWDTEWRPGRLKVRQRGRTVPGPAAAVVFRRCRRRRKGRDPDLS